MSTDPITPAQMKAVWASARTLGWDADKLHGEATAYLCRTHGIMAMAGRVSLKELSKMEAGELIDWMRVLAQDGHGRTPTGTDYRTARTAVGSDGSVMEYCSKAQARKMRLVASEMGKSEAWLTRFAAVWLRIAGSKAQGLKGSNARAAVLKSVEELTWQEARNFTVKLEMMARAWRAKQRQETIPGFGFQAGRR